MGIQIYILSKLMEDNNYPYKLKKELSAPIPLDELGGLTESKLYYHFDSLAKQGLIKAVEIIKEDHRPDKQVFEITDKGREALPKKIYKVFEHADSISDMVVGLAYIQYVDRDRIVNILEKKLTKIQSRWNNLLELENKIQIDQEKVKFVEFLSGYFSSRTEHTMYWLEKLISQIKQGEI